MGEDLSKITKVVEIPSTCIIESVIEDPIVTIAIPTYKRTDKLLKAVDSALTQEGFDNFEVIVVDNNPQRDCESERALRRYYDNPKFAYYKNTTNVGMIGNWNKLYLLSKGTYVVMLHDDDYIFPDFLRRLFVDYWHITKQNDLIYPHYCTNLWARDHYDGKKMALSLSINDFIVHNIVGPPVGLTARKDVVIAVGGFEQEFYPSSDPAFYIKCLSQHRKSVIIYDRPFSYYNEEGNTSDSVNIMLRFHTETGPKIFNAYGSKYNPILRFIRKNCVVSLMRFKTEGIDEKFKAQDLYKSKIAELKKVETLKTRTFLKLLVLINKYVLGISRYFRRKQI